MIVALGITDTQFEIPLADNLTTDNSTSKIQAWASSVRQSGMTLIDVGGAWVIGGMIFFFYLTLRDRSKPKLVKSNRILVDEMYDGKDIELAKRGYDAYSVKKLRLEGEPLQYDYSILKFVEENKMILITEDGENYGGCKENNLLCVKLGQNPAIEEIVKELEFLKQI